MQIGDRVKIAENAPTPIGVLARECWSVTESRLTARIWFDPETNAKPGDQGTIIEHDHVGESGWWIVDIDGFATPLHESYLEVVVE